MQVARGLHGGVGGAGGGRVRDASEEGARGERDEGNGAAGEGAWVVFYAQEAGEVGLDPGGDLVGGAGYGHVFGGGLGGDGGGRGWSRWHG